MHIILTHEQADFDALGSLFGAALTQESALAVLPRKQNRNVRGFLTLYGADFPFVDAHDLPPEPVDSVMLVDTQSLVTVKGVSERTLVRVIDHHARRPSTPAAWDLTGLKTGATTTFFVELLEERDQVLSPVQATLLLLAIYEDTGSLNYPDTTARDARAVAWLLDEGASLPLAYGYLNPPLSEDQRRAYDLLVGSAEAHQMDGLHVVVAQAESPGLTDEVSALAHKLRDLLEPEALFVLVHTEEGVRMVARSTTDRLDVAAVAAAFGGGGHERAASALIKNGSSRHAGEESRAESKGLGHTQGDQLLESTRLRLLKLLPKCIRPGITVSQVMSRMPRILAPDTSTQEAASLMQRYGFEGFPVVDKGHVVGLLTRRAVDRAISHRLNLAAASLMEAGEVTVHPEDTLQHLQTVMTQSGWGQVPVTDQDGQVVGIVTRTDLLKSLMPATARADRTNLRDKLEQELPAPQRDLLHAVADEASKMHLPAYIVGGFVRDLRLGRTSLDFDVVVEGDAIALAAALVEKYGGKSTSHYRFGTAKWFIPTAGFLKSGPATAPPPEGTPSSPELPAFIDLATARLEYYEHPGALPGVEHGSIRHDLHRRDFTINTLAVRLDGHHFGELHDYYGGDADLKHGLVRVLHSLSFIDDPTRLLRAVRYERRYSFAIETRTRQLMDEARSLLDRLSAERVRHELDLMLDEPFAPAMLTRLNELGLLKSISAMLPWSTALQLRLEAGLSRPLPPAWGLGAQPSTIPINRALGYVLWLQDLTPGQLEALNARLRFPAGLLRILHGASTLNADLSLLSAQPPSAWTFRLDEVPLLATYALFLGASGPGSGDTPREALEAYALKWRHVHPAVNGNTLRDLGLAAGPHYRVILDRLRAAWLDGEVSSSQEELDLLRRLIDAEGS